MVRGINLCDDFGDGERHGALGGISDDSEHDCD